MMLKATQLILQASQEEDITPYLEVVNKHGNVDDSERLYKHFLETKNAALLEPVWLHGDSALADDLFKAAILNDALRADFPPEVFYALSYLEHPETEHMLIKYYQQLFDGNLGWDFHTIVCLSLLNYRCEKYRSEIEAEIEKCFAVHLFPELIPVVASKTGNSALAEKLYKHGSSKASSDASAGLILGIALFGEAERDRFKSIIWNPDWEPGSSGTGNRVFTLMGMRYLGITFRELFLELQDMLKLNTENALTNLCTFVGLLQANLSAPFQNHINIRQPKAESFAAIYQYVFRWKTPHKDDSIIGRVSDFARSSGQDLYHVQEELYAIEELYKVKIAHQQELSCYDPAYLH